MIPIMGMAYHSLHGEIVTEEPTLPHIYSRGPSGNFHGNGKSGDGNMSFPFTQLGRHDGPRIPVAGPMLISFNRRPASSGRRCSPPSRQSRRRTVPGSTSGAVFPGSGTTRRSCKKRSGRASSGCKWPPGRRHR